ncbi:hypothetical protein MASR2M16_26650 [Thauera terpenica]
MRKLAGTTIEIVEDVIAGVEPMHGKVRRVHQLEAPRLRIVAARRPARALKYVLEQT